MKIALRNLFGALLVSGSVLTGLPVGLPEASAQVYFAPTTITTITRDARASVFGYVKNAWQVSSGQTATDMGAHRAWALSQPDATVAQEIERLTNLVMAHLRKLAKDRLVEVFAQIKQGALVAANKAAGHSLDSHRSWARGQTDGTLRGEIVRIALAGSTAF